MTDEKYKHFRNFMVNELGVTRTDIERWTKEAVAGEVSKLVGQMNLSAMASREVATQVERVVGGRYDSVNSPVVLAAVARVVGERLTISLTKPLKDSTHD